MKQPMLIISQCYHSYHIFVVQFDSDTFLKNAQDFIFELCDHRRKEERKEAREDFDEYGDVKEKILLRREAQVQRKRLLWRHLFHHTSECHASHERNKRIHVKKSQRNTWTWVPQEMPTTTR